MVNLKNGVSKDAGTAKASRWKNAGPGPATESKTTENENGEKKKKSSSQASSSSYTDKDGHLVASSNQVLGGRFTVRSELGEGTFGKVYKAEDAKHGDVVAVKCIRNIDRYTNSAIIETKILRKIYTAQKAAKVELLVTLYTSFTHQGHYCMVFEPLGKSLLDYIEQNKYCGFPLPYVRLIAAQLLSALTFLEGHSLVHTDLKLENILFMPCEDTTAQLDVPVRDGMETRTVTLPCQPNIKLIDFGGATYDSEHKSKVINTRQYVDRASVSVSVLLSPPLPLTLSPPPPL